MSEIKTILVVEDDQNIRDTLRDALELEGYHVLVAVNGQEGLEKIRLLPQPSLVLLDMMMPIMNGREFLNAVLADHRLAPIPVIIVSADIDATKQIGAKAYMKKPADLDLLINWISTFAV
jgi:two-component system chemotaxis response regulator CheY